MTARYFITGTDTSVGKTTVTCALLQYIAQKTRYRVTGYKPVATGSRYHSNKKAYYNDDALQLQCASNIRITYPEINPYCFNDATSPHIASRFHGISISLFRLSKGLHHLVKKADLVLVEGAGGWHTPLTETTLFSEWVQNEKLPVILIVPLKVGCINHALLTQQAILQEGIPFAGWILNRLSYPNNHDIAYQTTLCEKIKAPLLGSVGYLGNTIQFDVRFFQKR